VASWDTAKAQDFAGREKLRAHGEREFRKDVITVTDGVYVAVGYSMANAILIVGDGGNIIVDTTTKLDDAQAVRAEFAKISRAPVRAIIYTHSHPDHTGGARVFAGADRPEIYSSAVAIPEIECASLHWRRAYQPSVSSQARWHDGSDASYRRSRSCSASAILRAPASCTSRSRYIPEGR
jgi:glyoxylase-like metal-dependent hydrolase (beta-lactamase superfamily II)